MFSNTANFPRSRNEAERKENVKRSSDLNSEYNNPCLKELQLSYKCMDNNGYDRDKCTVYFANYKACSEFWNRVKSDRRKQGIVPHLPWPEEREKIREDYLKKLHNST